MAARGRPRGFDRDKALRQAMTLFWRQGYEGTSLGDLTGALGINKPSLYAAFGCKEALFREAIDLYNIEGSPQGEPFRPGRSAKEAMAGLLHGFARAYADPDTPPGCMVVLAATIGTSESKSIQAHMSALRRKAQDDMRRQVADALARDGLADRADPARIAAFYTTVVQGLSIQARDGATRAELAVIVDDALAAWDGLVGA
ncbi:TetR/AcrR family transcriptional regulator [Marinivivus vitaminiproducens]|uniref:TetR/AcrR family transcriptional regulator n=1 Tax=Marinivivus vitaminiproducens TaxID=3035935 RepID=UPI0027A006AE|nr:TetR/AcrR family transcriptional regulator [Geminicoccaceae bacterium SCSIO 64248]